MDKNISTESIAARILINLPISLVRRNNELIEEAGDVRDAIELKLNFQVNPIDALKKHLEYARRDERKLNVKNLIEGLESDISKDRALILSSSYIDSYLKEELEELVKETEVATAIIKEYKEVIVENFNFANIKEQLTSIVTSLADLPLARKEYIVNVMNEQLAALSSDVELTQQLPNDKFISNAISVINTMNINLTNVLNSIDRYKNDIISTSVIDMVKNSTPSEDVKTMINIDPYEPKEPSDVEVDLYQEAMLVEGDSAVTDMYVSYYTLIETVIAKIDLVKSKLNNLDKIDSSVISKTILDLGKFITTEVNNELTEDKSKSLVYLLQYTINNTTFVYNNITSAYTKVNKDIKLLSEAGNLCLDISNQGIHS